MKKVFLFLTMFLFAFTGVTRANVQQNRADQVIEQGFEDGLGDWTLNHCHSSSGVSSAYTAHSGSKVFRFYYTTNYPQYLISPEFEENGGGNITFYAARYSGSYPETYKVGYSFTTNDPSEFTWYDEVTCTTIYSTGYDEVSYDLPAGVKYVSIACTSNDQFYLFVDDITVTLEEPTPGELVEVTIGDPTSTTTNSYLPGYTLYDYAISQQIYTADEIGVAGTINTLTMWLKNSSSYARNINVYMKEVEATAFASNTAWESFTAADMVVSFTMPNENSTPIEVALPLDNPFVYSGTNNLAICFQDVTGSWSSGLGGVVMDAAGNQALYAYRDGTVYDPSNVGVTGTLLAKKNVIRLSIMTGGGPTDPEITYLPDPIDLGYRPNGAWMAPYVVTLGYNMPESVEVSAVGAQNGFYSVNAEVPFTLNKFTTAEVEVTTTTGESGLQEGNLVVLYSDSREAAMIPMTAIAYDPVDGDVYENAIEVTEFPYAGTAPDGIYKNYELPTETEGADAVYKVTFDNDVLFSAGTDGEDASVAIYTEDFEGEGGPMSFNNYEYTGPTVNPGPTSLWFNYAYTGSNTWYGTSAGGGFYFGYKISTDVIAAENLAGLTITTVEAAAREAYPYHCFIIEGGADPFEGNLIGMGTIENPTALYFFDINLSIPAYITGNADIWVIFYSDSPYAAYCGRYPVNTANGKIWTCNPNATTPQWTSNTNYTPVIYCHMLELPTGRTATMDLAKMEVKKGNGVVSEVAEAEGNVMDVAKAQIANNNSRDVVGNNIEDMYVPAGTYYVVAASTTDNFNVNMMTAEVPAPEQAYIISPYDGMTNITTPYLAEWVLGNYTEEMQVLLGTQYPPQTALIDWTDYLVESAFILDLEPNQSYFMQVNERNAAGTTMGEIIAFTTPINAVDEVIVTNPALYPGDAAMLTWTAPERSFKGYNVYQDGVKINESLVTTTEYAVEDLPYNMDGYVFQVSAVFDAGESALSTPDTAYMTGFGSVNGYVYDTDTLHPIANATMVVVGIDEFGAIQQYEFLTDETGFYEGEVLAGLYAVGILTEGYETAATAIYVAYDQLTEVEDIITHEFYYPLGQITATEEEADVLVEWSWDPAEMIVDFETGDFSQAEFTLPAQYPWAITTTNPYEGTYCMKSTCEGQASATSYIEATVEVPFAEAKMGFYVKVSSEANYDKFHFYIDGVEKGSALSGQADYVYKEFAVEGGVHTYKWEYTKDSSVNSNDDCIYVDNITMFRKDEPVPPTPGATVYDFDDDTMMGWTSIDADGDGNGWVSSANPGIYHNSGVSLSGTGHNESEAYVISGSYANQTQQALTPDNFLVAPAQISAQDGASISFYACAQDASYAAEHFGVAVSTTGHTSGNDFTTIQEWTMTAKNAPAEESHREVRGTRQGAWYNYSVDLSSYAGQDIWVAIRHFNCTDMFILNVDDITLYDGSAKGGVRANREFVSYNLYRRNNIDAESVENPTLLAEGIAGDVYEYLDTEWPALPFGEWQWGIQATYEGYAPVPNRDVLFSDDFEDGALTNWSTVDADGDGDTWQNATPAAYGIGDAHSGTNCASSWSWNSYTMYPDNWMISPMVEGATSIQYYVATNTAYPDHYGVYASSTGTATSNFTLVFEETAGSKGGNGTRSSMTQAGTRAMSDWMIKNIDLPEGTKYVAFRHWNSDDMNYLFIDDVTINGSSAPVPPTPGPTGDGLSEILWSNVIDKDMIATLTINVALNNGQSPVGAVVELEAAELEYEFTVDETGVITEEIRKGEYLVEVELEGYTGIIDILEADTDEIELTYVLNEIIAPVEGLYVSPTGWAMWEGGSVGPTPGPTGDDSFEESFEGGLNGWNVLTVNTDGGDWIHSSQNLGGYDYTELAHTGTGFAMCYSFVDYVGSFNTDSYMYTPQKYDIVNGSTLTFFADNANDSYPENFSVVIATVDNPTAADFTQIWNGGAKGTGSDGAIVRHNDTRYENWRQHTIDLSAYAGQSVYIGFHDVNYDMYEIWIDDVTLSTGAKADRAALSYKVMLDGEYIGETYLPFVQLPVEGMEEGSEHVASIAPLYASGMGEWMSYTFTYTSCDNFAGTTSFNATANNADVTLTWTLPDGPTPPTPPTPGEGQWYQYGTDEVATGVGAGGAFYWGVMFPAGSYQGNVVTKAATYELSGYPFSGNVTIYNDGTTAPASPVGTMPVSVAGAADQWAEFEFAQPIAIDPSKNLWIIFYNETSTTYPAAACVDAGDPNARWVSLDGSSWMDLAAAGLSGYSWIIKAYVATSNKGEVTEISVPTYACANAGNVSADHIARGNRDAWDLVGSLTGTSAGQQAVATDGNYIYTASWQATPTGGYTFYQYTMDGTFVEGFDIAGATGIRDLATDGQYFYGSSGGTQIFCMDFTTRTLVSTINCSGLTSRHLTYDPVRDGFWSGNWTTLALYSRTGALIQNGPATTSAYGSSYYVDADGVEHLYLFCQTSPDGSTNRVQVIDYNITTNTLVSDPVHICNDIPGYDSANGIAGGCFIGTYDNKTCFFANVQQSPNVVGIYDLNAGPVPPTPVEGILGVVLYRNDEFVGMFDANTTSYVDEGLESGHYDYTIRVIYGGEQDVTYYAMSCGDEAEADITVGVTENDEVVNSIYPNPTSGDLYINATAMKHVTVFNAMGQMVLDQEVSGDSMVLNMGQLESGVYMVKVTTETGSNVKRINVVK